MYKPPPETPLEPMEFLCRSWSLSAHNLSQSISPAQFNHHKPPTGKPPAGAGDVILEDPDGVSGNPFLFASSDTSQLVMERIMPQSQEVSPRTSGRLSHSSGPLNGSLTDSPPDSPSEIDDKFSRLNNNVSLQYGWGTGGGGGLTGAGTTGGGKTVGRWFKDRREKKKEETRAHNAQLHASVTVAGVAAAVAAIAAATAATSGTGKDEQRARTDMAVASAATLVAAQCVEAAEAMGADREHLAAVISSAVNVKSAGDIMTITAAAATALRGVATLKARALKDVWNMASVIPLDKGIGNGSNDGSSSSFSGELIPEDHFLGVCSRELLARGCELLKRTRKGDLHWKVVSVYVNKSGKVTLKMKSRIAAGTLTKKKKNEVLEVMKDIPAWPGRHLLEGGENRRYFALKTVGRGVVEFECRNQREYDIWTEGVSRLLSIASERNGRQGLKF